MSRLRVLGVYKLDITPEVFAAQLPMYDDVAQCRDHFSSVVLIEAMIEGADPTFGIDEFTQPNPEYQHGSAQLRWDEGLLSADGETLISRRIGCVRGAGPLRFAFYLHYWNPALPLRWSGGEVVCPPIEPMPVRLEILMPYRPCD
jgi:hypothetical protein